MKKLFSIFFFCAALVWAYDSQKGVPVSIRLVTGSVQKAEYLGSSGDTLFLGGFIADTFTVVKIIKDRVSEWRDSAGNSITFSLADSLLNVKQKVSPPDSSRADSSSSPRQLNLSRKSLLFPVMRRPIDSALAERIRDWIYPILKESGERPEQISTEDFPQCKDSPCILQEAEKLGAKSLWTSEIRPASHQDSLDIFLNCYSLSQQKIQTEQVRVSAKNATGELLSDNRFLNWIQKLLGTYKEPESKSTKSVIHVETDPEGAILSRKGEHAICQTPCTFAVADTGKLEFEAFWSVEKTLWANKATLRPIPGDTAKIHLRLKRVRPEVEIRTVPAGAKIFDDAEITPRSRPVGKTPQKIHPIEPGIMELHLWKDGFRDSTIQFQTYATEKTVIEIQLDSIRTPEERQAQNVFHSIQKRLFWGHVALGTAIAPAIAGGILLFLSERDRDKARDLKNELSMPSSGNGAEFNRLVKKNHKYADRSQVERYSGIGFLVLAGGLFATGIVLSF